MSKAGPADLGEAARRRYNSGPPRIRPPGAMTFAAFDLRTPETDTFHDLEDHGGDFVFRWTHPRFRLKVPDGLPFVTLRCASLPAGNRLKVQGAKSAIEVELPVGWQTLDVATFGAVELTFEVSQPFVADGVERGVMLRDALFHADELRHERLFGRHQNAVRNEAEYRAGAPVIESVPPRVRITTSKTCNIANEKACVYCAWDFTKALEAGSPDQSPDFLTGMGRYLSQAQLVTDCSYGEVPLERHSEDVLAIATEFDRRFDFTSNGQMLSSKMRARLLGKPARVHVSIDSANAEGYRRYRDHRFDLVVNNLKALCEERKATGNLPEVLVSFIVMRSNRDEIADFLRLMAEIGVDQVTLRDLYREPSINGLRTIHYGYRFDYEAERLSRPELETAGQKGLETGASLGLRVILEWRDFSRNVAATDEREPICSEPWQTAYLLNRGIMPCCYGRDPIATWDEIDQTDLEGGIAAALNSPQMQDLRRDLAAGRLGSYCEKTHSCPIVKARRAAEGAVPAA